MDKKASYHHKQRNYFLFIIAQLYIVQGIPVGLTFDAYPILLRKAEVSLTDIAIIPLAGLPWVLKFLWAPIVENYWINKIGFRKSWLIPMQCLLAFLITIIAFTPFTLENMTYLGLIIILSCIVAATQDIATDGLATDLSQNQTISQVNTIQVMGNIVGMLLGGAGVSVFYDYLGKTYSILLLVGFIILSIIQLMIWKEPNLFHLSQPKSRAKIYFFFKRRNALPLLLLTILIPFAGSVILTMTKFILLDHGLSVSDIGIYTGIGSYITMLIGCTIASYLLKTKPPYETLQLGFSLIIPLIIYWSILYYLPNFINLFSILIIITILGIGIGIINVSIYTITMSFVKNGKQSTTDYAIFQSSLLLSEIIASSLSMTLAGYFNYMIAFFIALLSIVIISLNIKYIEKIASSIPSKNIASSDKNTL